MLQQRLSPPNDDELSYLADAIEREIPRVAGVYTASLGSMQTGRLAHYAAEVARDHTRWLRSKGLTNRR